MTKPCYIISGLRFGALRFREVGQPEQVRFAWQIYQDKVLWARFDRLDRFYIKQLAAIEIKDAWYKQAGERLLKEGFAALGGTEDRC